MIRRVDKSKAGGHPWAKRADDGVMQYAGEDGDDRAWSDMAETGQTHELRDPPCLSQARRAPSWTPGTSLGPPTDMEIGINTQSPEC